MKNRLNLFYCTENSASLKQGTHIHGRASTSRMRTAISGGQRQPQTAVLPLLGPTSVAKPLG